MQLPVQTTTKDEIVDITDAIEEQIKKQSIQQGTATIFIQHTTAALTLMDLDPGTDLDFLDAIRAVLPHIVYRHPHDPSHAPDHILASIIGMSLTIPFEEKHLLLGTWQRVVVVELDGPRIRNIILSLS